MRVARRECGRNGPEGDPAGRLVHGAGTRVPSSPRRRESRLPALGRRLSTAQLHVVDIASGQDRVLPVDGMALGVIESNRSDLSPDGSQILFDRYEADGDHWAVAPVAAARRSASARNGQTAEKAHSPRRPGRPTVLRSSRITRLSPGTMSSGSSTRQVEHPTSDCRSRWAARRPGSGTAQ